jgi:ATP-dependent Clp protease, proteolytic subunit ClpP
MERVTVYDKLLEDRIILLTTEVNPLSANDIKAKLLYLEAEDPDADIYLYIDSPGGEVHTGLGIYDVMNYIKCDVNTVCIGEACSMGAFLLSSGTKGKRYALPNSQIMIHQVSAGTQGKATDMEISLKHVLNLKNKLSEIIAKNTGKDIEQVKADMERDKWLTAQEALEYGLIDEIMEVRE